MDLGFETIGNATLIVHDAGPLLVTDPWLVGHPYFGSWTMSHEIPEEQREAALAAPFMWLSHGHPDHLHAESLELFGPRRVLLPDHVGHRIHDALIGAGREVTVLTDREWTSLSPRVRVMCIADHNQDAILLVDIGGTLVLNLNDAQDGPWKPFVRRLVREAERSVVLRLSGFGDADMINLFDEGGRRIPGLADLRSPVGADIGRMLRSIGADAFVPFSSMHRYQRTDSIWANAHVTQLDDHAVGFDDPARELLPAFVRYDARNGTATALDPPPRPLEVRDPADFGDDWSEVLDDEEIRRAREYFTSFSHLARHLDYIVLRVGGKETAIELTSRRFRSGISFEVPRASLMAAIDHEVFDDLLIGNFMKTTLHGRHPRSGLYPHFTPFVAKYADNGGARTREELREYFTAYRRRAPVDWVRHRLEQRSRDVLRAAVPVSSPLYRAARDVYRSVR